MKHQTATPYVACYVIFRRGSKIAFVLRQNTSWMAGHYSLPAGKLEQQESIGQGAVREAKEESGVIIDRSSLMHRLTVHRKGEDSEWVDVYFEAELGSQEPYNAEPHVHSELAWLDIEALPDNVSPAQVSALKHIADGNQYAEYGW